MLVSSANKVLGVALAAMGLVPMVAGAFDFCLLAPLFGKEIRARKQAGLQ